VLIGHPVFWLLVAAVAAPLLAEIPLGFKVPVVVLEVLLGIAMDADVTAALVGAALLSVLLFPTIAGVLLGRTKASSAPDSRPEWPARQP
jgi:hypothetical protein